MRALLAIALTATLTGCAAMSSRGVVEAEAEPFPHPGIYSGAAMNGIVTYKIREDGTGVSCFRNKFSGDMFFGDLKYDGEYIHTEDGTVSVDSLSEGVLEVSAGISSPELHRVDAPPTACKDFFAT